MARSYFLDWKSAMYRSPTITGTPLQAAHHQRRWWSYGVRQNITRIKDESTTDGLIVINKRRSASNSTVTFCQKGAYLMFTLKHVIAAEVDVDSLAQNWKVSADWTGLISLAASPDLAQLWRWSSSAIWYASPWRWSGGWILRIWNHASDPSAIHIEIANVVAWWCSNPAVLDCY